MADWSKLEVASSEGAREAHIHRVRRWQEIADRTLIDESLSAASAQLSIEDGRRELRIGTETARLLGWPPPG